MNTVRRTHTVTRKIRKIVFRIPEQKYVTAGDRACREMMHTPRRRRRQPDLEEESILAWARFESAKEMIEGFWERKTAHAA